MNEKLIAELHALRQQAANGNHFVDEHRALNWAGKHPQSELYSYLEWDNEKAGHEWRLAQMRELIRRTVEFIQSPEGGPPVECRAYISVPVDGGERLYFETPDVLKDPVERRKLIVRLLKSALAQTMSWPQLNELDNWRKNTRQLIIKFSED